MAMLSPSVPLPVNTISDGFAPRESATSSRAISMTSSASAPMRYSEDGLAKCCRSTRSAASAAASDTRVVAALSR